MKLALFFTFGVSAKLWNEKGLLDREKLIYEKLVEKGMVDKVYWFTYGTTDKQIEGTLKKGIEIISMPTFYRSRIGQAFYSFLIPIIYYRILKNVDIYKTNQMSGSWTAVIAKVIFNKKLIVRTGYTWSKFKFRTSPVGLKTLVIKLIERIACQFSNAMVMSAPHDLEYIRNSYRLDTNIIVIPNYVDTDVFKPRNIPKVEGSVCFIGRLTEAKNLFSLLDALVGLPYKLTIIGSGEEGERIDRYAKERNVNIEFRSNIPNSKLPEVLNKSEAFILPSHYEGTPKVLLEAMACGLPCIGSNVEGIREIIKHKKNGYLCETDAKSIRQAILDVLKNRAMQKEIGRRARKTILDNFSLRRSLEREIVLYESLLKMTL
jgi:glycosyltransferase involved in cell wall biosynthesis